jgi:pimeloyl-ACP methyl ester carboxylesterase
MWCRLLLKTAILALLIVRGAAYGSAQGSLPRFERSDCLISVDAWSEKARVECGRLVVPESRLRPNGPSVSLAVAIFHAKNPSGEPPLVILHGGPGGLGLLQSASVQRAAAWSIAGRRDIVMYDQRVAGLSGPRPCPPAVERKVMNTGSEEADAVRACMASLKASGRDPAAYSTPENAADAIDLRRVLGYAKWDVYGVSYGSRLAQELIRRDGSAIRSVTLHSVLPPGPGPYAEVKLRVQEAFDHLFARCQADSACAAAVPTLAQDFDAVYEQLTVSPLMVEPPRDASPVRLDGARFVTELRTQLSNPAQLLRIPLLVRELHHGDRMRAAQLLLTDRNEPPNTSGLLVSAFDLCGSKTLGQDAAAIDTRVRAPFRQLLAIRGLVQVCDVWQERVADPSTFAPVSSDVPALILSTEFDDRTPAAYGRLVASRFKRAYHYEIPREGHGQLPPGCATGILLQFLANPLRQPDGSCLEDTAALAFETRALDGQRVALTISGTGPAATPFAGQWEAILPGPFGVFGIDLKVDGGALTGTIGAARGAVPISEGRASQAELSLKATSADGDRTIALRGMLVGDEITFTREFTLRPGGFGGGQGIFGAQGPSRFVVRRVN